MDGIEEKITDTENDIQKVSQEVQRLQKIEQQLIGRLITLREFLKEKEDSEATIQKENNKSNRHKVTSR